MGRQVAARLKGDNYQGRFFWYQAVGLLFEDSRVETVVLEHDTASGVDDVVVYYKPPGVSDAGMHCTAEYFQVKYHVDQRDSYSSDAMMDPGFIKARSSLLQRFYAAYQGERERHQGLRLGLVSNWTWRSDDCLARAIRDNGALPNEFFSSGPRSPLGRVRNKWKDAIGAADGEFEDFARRLRLKLNYFSRGDLLEVLADRLYRGGLQPIDQTKEIVPYDDLALKFIMNGRSEFDARSLRNACEAEGLVVDRPRSKDPRAIGVRSFMPFAEHLEDECESFVCLAEHFDGRQIRDPDLWRRRVFPDLAEFLRSGGVRREELHLLLECHLSISYAAGYVLHRASGVGTYPVQKGRERQVWKPAAVLAGPSDPLWTMDRIENEGGSGGLVLAVSLTHDVRKKVMEFLGSSDLQPPVLIDIRSGSGVGASSVRGPDHAAALAEQLQQLVLAERRRTDSPLAVHLFAAAPNSFMFFLGQLGRAMDPVQLYEFDFEGGRGYSASLSFPPVAKDLV